MSEVTRMLYAIEQGDPHAARQLLPLVGPRFSGVIPPKMALESMDTQQSLAKGRLP
jgi:hypothetical protein